MHTRIRSGLSVTFIRFLLFCSFAFAGTTLAQQESQLREGGTIAGLNLPGYGDQALATKVYLVQLKTPSAAEYHATLLRSKLGTTSSSTKTLAPAFDKNSAAIQSYTQRLVDEQNKVLASAAPAAEKIYSYLFSLNGFAVRMTEAQAVKMVK